MLKDNFGRKIEYLRVSITDRCPAHCIYCMPKTVNDLIKKKDILSFKEILHIIKIGAQLGLTAIKLTGGEPLARRGVLTFVKSLAHIPHIKRISITTNAMLLNKKSLSVFAQINLNSITISLDALHEEAFCRITNTQFYNTVISNLHSALSCGIPLKINCVPIEGYNDDEIIPIAKLAYKENVLVRFIELMPLGCGAGLRPILQPELKQRLELSFGKLNLCDNENEGMGPARYYRPSGFNGKIGFISALSHRFCDKCNRLRLTSAGDLYPCLAGSGYIALKPLLRDKKNMSKTLIDDAIKNALLRAAAEKPASHFFSDPSFNDAASQQKMYGIGG